jgi:hypothetical protein
MKNQAILKNKKIRWKTPASTPRNFKMNLNLQLKEENKHQHVDTHS